MLLDQLSLSHFQLAIPSSHTLRSTERASTLFATFSRGRSKEAQFPSPVNRCRIVFAQLRRPKFQKFGVACKIFDRYALRHIFQKFAATVCYSEIPSA